MPGSMVCRSRTSGQRSQHLCSDGWRFLKIKARKSVVLILEPKWQAQHIDFMTWKRCKSKRIKLHLSLLKKQPVKKNWRWSLMSKASFKLHKRTEFSKTLHSSLCSSQEVYKTRQCIPNQRSRRKISQKLGQFFPALFRFTHKNNNVAHQGRQKRMPIRKATDPRIFSTLSLTSPVFLSTRDLIHQSSCTLDVS